MSTFLGQSVRLICQLVDRVHQCIKIDGHLTGVTFKNKLCCGVPEYWETFVFQSCIWGFQDGEVKNGWLSSGLSDDGSSKDLLNFGKLLPEYMPWKAAIVHSITVWPPFMIQLHFIGIMFSVEKTFFHRLKVKIAGLVSSPVCQMPDRVFSCHLSRKCEGGLKLAEYKWD